MPISGDVPSLDLEAFLEAMRVAHNGVLPLNEDQEQALRHDYQTPLWIIAGPGTGKTHTLAWLVLKRILVDSIAPNRIILTTFTRKAASELESRLILNRQKLMSAGLTQAEAIEITQILIGTLHSLCSRILQNERYEPAFRIRVLEDELTQQFFIRRSSNPLSKHSELDFWQRFGIVGENDRFPPNTAKRVEGTAKLFNRMTENNVDLDAMLASSEEDFVVLAQAYQAYQTSLQEEHRTDQAHLQRHFLNFLNTAEGQLWLDKGFTILVDEYQDTNPVQEEIYFKLAGTRADLTVVGDDDQSLYRFRGATVEALIDFDRACQIYLGKIPSQVNLRENRRSHPNIVGWVNRFIENHPEMTDPNIRVRAPGKRSLLPASSVVGNYPPIMAIVERNAGAAAAKMVPAIRDLKQHGFVEDYSQVAILTFSTRETSHAIGTYTTALRNAGIPLYNPRNRTAHKDRRFLAMIGGLSFILDWVAAYKNFDKPPTKLPSGVPGYIDQARTEFEALLDSGEFLDLKAYADSSISAIKNAKYDPDKSVNYLTRKGGRRVTTSGLLYKLLAHEPFASDLNDPEGAERLKALNLILAEFESLYDDGELKLALNESGERVLDRWTLYNFYAVFVEGIHDGLNDPENDEISIQDGMVNIMTIHQSKGLEFEVVFVLRPDKQPFLSDTHILEDELDPFVRRPTKPAQRRTQELRAAEDAIRLFFVAYSRAKRLLILTGNKINEWDRVLGRTETGNSLNTPDSLRNSGVHLL